MPERKKSRTKNTRQHKRTRKFRKNRKQRGGMKEVRFEDLVPGTMYLIQSKNKYQSQKAKKPNKKNPERIPAVFKDIRQKGIFLHDDFANSHESAAFNIIDSNIVPSWKATSGRDIFSKHDYNFYLPEKEMIEARVNDRSVNEFLRKLVDEKFAHPGDSYFIPHTTTTP